MILSRRVLLFEWLAACCGFALRYDMWAARCPLEERVYRGAGRSRRRARGDGVFCVERSRPPLSLWWLSSPGLLERERSDVSAHFCSRSACVRKVVFVYEHTNMVVTTTTTIYYYVIAPGSGRGPGGHISPLQVVSVRAALFRHVSTPSCTARSSPQPQLRPSRSTVVSH